MNENIKQYTDSDGLLPFELVAKARLHCFEESGCESCPLNVELGTDCGSVDLSAQLNLWLERFLLRLSRMQKQYSDVTDEEFLDLIR